jgi:hypothetical protein
MPPGFVVASPPTHAAFPEIFLCLPAKPDHDADRTLTIPNPEPLLWGSGWCAAS